MTLYTPGISYETGSKILPGTLYHAERGGRVVGFRLTNVFEGKGAGKYLAAQTVTYHWGDEVELSVPLGEFLRWLKGA